MKESQHIIKPAAPCGDPLGQRGYVGYTIRFRGPVEEAARFFPHRVREVADGVYAVIESDVKAPLLGKQAGDEVEVWGKEDRDGT